MSFLFPRLDMLVPWRVNNRKVDHNMDFFGHNSIYVFWEILQNQGPIDMKPFLGKLFFNLAEKSVQKKTREWTRTYRTNKIFKGFGLWHNMTLYVFNLKDVLTWMHKWHVCWKWIERDMCMHSWIEFEFIHPPYFFLLSWLKPTWSGCFPTITQVRSVARNFHLSHFPWPSVGCNIRPPNHLAFRENGKVSWVPIL